jgi:hypothetical protein
MSEATPRGQRAKRMALVAVGGSVVLTMALAPVAQADQVTRQRSETSNSGTATANSGGNTAIGNSSINTAVTGQTATGGTVGANSGGGGNTSNGTAVISTGTATAQGNVATNNTTQGAVHGGDAGGVHVAEQSSFVTNTATALANTGGNTAIGNDSDNLTDTLQSASGDVASNSATGGNASDGTGSVTTGAADATGNVADNAVVQAVAGGVGAGVSVVTQTVDVLNSGDATADSGGNVGIGNSSINTAISDQTADGGIVGANSSTGGNSSNGTGSVVTGAATAAGNVASNRTTQSAGPDASFLSVILQDIITANSGIATAASGDNTGIGNESDSFILGTQTATGDVASNAAPAGNTSDGLGFLSTGIADAVGNSASNEQTQSATG